MFILVATTIYGSLHAYLWWRATRQLDLRGAPALALGLFLAAMVVAPFLGRMLRDGSALLHVVELVAFVWMGAALYLFTFNIAVDLWNVAARLARLAALGAPPVLGGPRLFAGIAAATTLVVGWAAVEAASVRIRHVVVPTAKRAAGTAPVRIVQVSDVHLGLLTGERRLTGILRRVRESRPDLIVATGDILDAVGDHLEPLSAMWRDIAPPLGKFAVTGNHEYYSGIRGAVSFLEDAGFHVLRDRTHVVPGTLNLVGLEYRGPRRLQDPRVRPRPLATLIEEADPALATVVLRHLPVGFEEEAAPLGVALQLSGHTHDGQLWPFRWLVRLSFRHTAGLVRAGESLLYVSRGTGTWGPPLRFLAPPEVTLIELVPAAGADGGLRNP